MNSRTLFFSELKYRWMGCLLAALAVAVAVFAVCVSLRLLADFDGQTQREISDLQYRSQQRMDALENEARIFAKSLGFNILITHSAQRLETFYSEDVNTHYLTDADADRLAEAKLSFLNHLLPFLRHRYALEAFGGDVILAGIKGEIYIKSRHQQPIEVSIEPGEVHLGATVAARLNLEPGGTLEIGGRDYTVTRCRELLGTEDDSVIFMNLGDSQKLLGLEGKISGVLALSCNCGAGDLDPIRREVCELVPEASVVEFTIRAKARERARAAIKQAAEAEVADIVASRHAMRGQLELFSLLFLVLIVAAVTVLLFFFYSHNMKERCHEIAILRTLGMRVRQLIGLVTAKAILLACTGTLVGYVGAAVVTAQVLPESGALSTVGSGVLLLWLLAATGLVSITASLIPALMAARRDPGIVLNEEA